jgi:hypothetical protein
MDARTLSLALLGVALGCQTSRPEHVSAKPQAEPLAPEAFNPLKRAYDSLGVIANLEAGVPSMCYTKTDGFSNPCWVCHTRGAPPNARDDSRLQQDYAFSSFALENRWRNLFEDRTLDVQRISDAEVLAYVRQDNYRELRSGLIEADKDFPGYVPDLDFDAGFDDEGFARDGSEWRAVRYVPFPGTFWPTNGSTDDVFIRLPAALRASRAEYKANLAILEAAVGSDPRLPDRRVERSVEPLDEKALGLDIDGDGQLRTGTARLVGLPARYAGAAGGRVRRNLYPQGTEFLHSVRYLDPDQPGLTAKRMKELRYMRKQRDHQAPYLREIYRQEDEEKLEGEIPNYQGSAATGFATFLGWQLQGYIEDPSGRLRLQTDEEHRFCMGCHSGLGVTVDGTFAFPRKLPGTDGYRYQDLRGQRDRPQVGHTEGEVLTYLKRALGGDELRANAEMRERFFVGDRVDEHEIRRGAAGGDRDLAWLLAPSRERAIALDKAYLALVRRDRFQDGRDPSVEPVRNVLRVVENGSTELERSGRVYADGRLQLDWSMPALAPARR